MYGNCGDAKTEPVVATFAALVIKVIQICMEAGLIVDNSAVVATRNFQTTVSLNLEFLSNG
jgi:hypothetical protein